MALYSSVLALQQASLPNCPNPTAIADTPMNCDFYTDCLEAKFQCGAEGYPIGYGDRYCNKFTENYDKFDEEGKKWIDGTLICLKESLLPDMNNNDAETCDDVYNHAFDSHVKCYTENGFCDIAFDFANPIKTAGFYKSLMAVYEVKDFASLIAIK